jgi:hypothetical protein
LCQNCKIGLERCTAFIVVHNKIAIECVEHSGLKLDVRMDLEEDMASLRINDTDFKVVAGGEFEFPDPETSSSGSCQPRWSALFKAAQISCTEKRRVFTKPAKFSKDKSFKNTENYYLDKRSKKRCPVLETIFEDSKSDEDSCRDLLKTQKVLSIDRDILEKQLTKPKKKLMKVKGLSALQRVNDRQKMPLKFTIEMLDEIMRQ